MKLSISNIGWDAEYDNDVYALMKKYGFEGLEIAPTRIFPEKPYDKNTEAAVWLKNLKKTQDFVVPSMQSIWYGRKEKIFNSLEERQFLIHYTKEAVDFAAAIECKNLVFGCPGNRNIFRTSDYETGILFFKEIGNYAAECGTAIGMEANPTIYNTNYINDTISAFELIEKVGSKGFQLNLDIGTMIQNEENINVLMGKVKYINHVHISEPGLKPVKERKIHIELKTILEAEGYQKFVSIEMGKLEDVRIIEEKMQYVKGVFG